MYLYAIADSFQVIIRFFPRAFTQMPQSYGSEPQNIIKWPGLDRSKLITP